MTDRPEVTDDLYRTAKALAREVAETFGDRREDPDDNWARQHIGDWADTLFLAGWQVQRDEGDVGLAKHRMRDRKKNLLRDVHAEPPFRYSDPYRKALRIHTKHIATEDA